MIRETLAQEVLDIDDKQAIVVKKSLRKELIARGAGVRARVQRGIAREIALVVEAGGNAKDLFGPEVGDVPETAESLDVRVAMTPIRGRRPMRMGESAADSLEPVDGALPPIL